LFLKSSNYTETCFLKITKYAFKIKKKKNDEYGKLCTVNIVLFEPVEHETNLYLDNYLIGYKNIYNFRNVWVHKRHNALRNK
jgi:hypothetical protein